MKSAAGSTGQRNLMKLHGHYGVRQRSHVCDHVLDRPRPFGVDVRLQAVARSPLTKSVQVVQRLLCQAFVKIGVLREQTFGKEKLFVHPKLMSLLTRDSNTFTQYR